MAFLLQYDSEVKPLVPIAPPAETITVDKWRSPAQYAPTRPRLATALIPSLAFVAVLATPTTTYVQAQNAEPIRVESFQYEDGAAPVLVPAVAPSTAVHIQSQSPEPIWPQSFQYDDGVKPIVVTAAPEGAVTIDKWVEQWPQPYLKRRWTVFHRGTNTAIAGQPDEGIPPVYWILQTNTPPSRLKPRRYVYPFSVSDQLFNTPTPPATPAVFINGQSPEPIWRQSFQYDDARPVKFTTDAAETITLDKWGQPTNRPPRDIARRQVLYPTQVRPISIVFLESPTLNKWVQPIQQPRFDIKRRQWLYQFFTIDAKFHIVPSPPVAFPAVWQNLGTVTINAANLATVTLLTENLSDGDVMFESDADVVLITEDTDVAVIIYEDVDTVDIKYEDTDTV